MLQRLQEAWLKRGPYHSRSNGLPSEVARPRTLASPDESRAILEYILTKNIIPAWYPGAVDGEIGGYRGEMDPTCRWAGETVRHLISQTRTLWFLSSLARSPYGDKGILDAAQHGFRFLAERMWDPEYGGFFWQVDAATGEVLKADKDMCGQGFALLAVSEYALASNDKAAVSLASELFRLIDTRGHDPDFPGYFEILVRDWRGVPARTYLGRDSSEKTMNVHLHLLESFTLFCALTGDDLARKRLEELVGIQRDLAFRPETGASSERHLRDWSPVRGNWNRVTYGHDLENIWMLADACAITGGPTGDQIDLYRSLFASCLRDGFDHDRGGFYYWGRHGRPARERKKSWWVQAEALIAALTMFYLTDDLTYADCYRDTLDWIVSAQIDWENGDWHPDIAPNGRPMGDKAAPWKCCYHNGRAMLRCLSLLQQANSQLDGANGR